MSSLPSQPETTFLPGRRRFMTGAAGLTFGIAFGLPDVAGHAAAAQDARQVAMNAWVTLSSDGTVFIMSPATEMGQGSYTAVPVILADAMDAAPDAGLTRLLRQPLIIVHIVGEEPSQDSGGFASS